MGFSVRPLEGEDKVEWLELWQQYLEFYKSSVADEVSESSWARMMDPDGDIYGFKAVDENGVMVGMVTYLFHATTWTIGPRCYLNDLFTLPQTRGKGVGRALIAAVHDAATTAGAEQVYWMTQEFNYLGRTLYDKVAERTPFIKYVQKV